MSPSQARAFTEKHRKAQLVLRAATLRDLLKLWPAFDINNITGSWGAFEEAVMLLVQARAATSNGLATAYYREFRQLNDVEGPLALKPFLIDRDKVATGLRIVGPANAVKQLSL